MITEGWIDLLITTAVMGGETQGQRLIASLSDKKVENAGGISRTGRKRTAQQTRAGGLED